MSLVYKTFANVNLDDPFFDSLKSDYPKFVKWFMSKGGEKAYVSYNEDNEIDGFLYLKVEDEALVDMTPSFPKKKRVKLGTFKIVAHGTRLGERFVRKILDFALSKGLPEIYVTIFDKHEGLINLLERYGFEKVAVKNEITASGQEGVYFKPLTWRE
ncbi:GNAT family N-acetyltransferase [Rahnella variigena]|uniref:GNAT family N-acetyltransferase n=1 Tax=Rahnella variigena TaxID=574964 RepID=UPI00132FEF47|nr:GNAT family N-acetyltransferase [Rahnella variigena]